jgi:hypothetical protein
LPTRAELLVDHFIRFSGIAGIVIEADGTIAPVDAVSMFDARTVICCAAGSQTKVAALAEGRIAAKHTHADALAAVHAAAAEAGIGLTPFDKVIRRAFAAVGVVEQTLADMQAAGQLRDINQEFKALRRADPGLRYHDHLHRKKIAMVEALARQAS